MSKIILTLLVLAIASVAYANKPIKPKCGDHETWTDCGTACPVTCRNQNNKGGVCIDLCVKGCFCDKGYIRDECTKRCVKPCDCTKE